MKYFTLILVSVVKILLYFPWFAASLWALLLYSLLKEEDNRNIITCIFNVNTVLSHRSKHSVQLCGKYLDVTPGNITQNVRWIYQCSTVISCCEGFFMFHLNSQFCCCISYIQSLNSVLNWDSFRKNSY